MSIMIADDHLAAELERADGPVKVQVRDGRPLGTFTPETPARLQLRISDEELRRREADTRSPGYTLEQLLAKLKGS